MPVATFQIMVSSVWKKTLMARSNQAIPAGCSSDIAVLVLVWCSAMSPADTADLYGGAGRMQQLQLNSVSTPVRSIRMLKTALNQICLLKTDNSACFAALQIAITALKQSDAVAGCYFVIIICKAKAMSCSSMRLLNQAVHTQK